MAASSVLPTLHTGFRKPHLLDSEARRESALEANTTCFSHFCTTQRKPWLRAKQLDSRCIGMKGMPCKHSELKNSDNRQPLQRWMCELGIRSKELAIVRNENASGRALQRFPTFLGGGLVDIFNSCQGVQSDLVQSDGYEVHQSVVKSNCGNHGSDTGNVWRPLLHTLVTLSAAFFFLGRPAYAAVEATSLPVDSVELEIQVRSGSSGEDEGLSGSGNLDADSDSPYGLKPGVKPRVQEQINEAFANKNGQDLSLQDLQGGTFMEASLRDTDMHGSDLRGAMFTKAVLYRANLESADLSDALIDRAVLVNANLRNAILRGAWLALSDLTGADITGADFTDAIIDKFQLKKLCERASGVNPETGASTRVSLRCDSTQFYSGSGSRR